MKFSETAAALMDKLAIDGGKPVREKLLPYGTQCVDAADEQAVIDVMRSGWLTTGPAVEAFEQGIAGFTGAKHAVAVSSGTAALHAAMYVAGVGPGDEVIVPAMTFAATANAVLFQGGTPVFADVNADTLLLSPEEVEAKITPKTKAVVPVDYAGQPCDYDALRAVAEKHDLIVIADSCHAFGAQYKGRKTGVLADLTVFSFHPVKHVTTGEGGMIVTDRPELAEKMCRFRNHGITADHKMRSEQGTWYYEMEDLGFNYRISDLQCALGSSQMQKLPGWLARRQEIARRYDEAFKTLPAVVPLVVSPDVRHAYHLYVVQLDLDGLSVGRSAIFAALRAENIGVNVHYIPVYLHPYYQRLGYKEGLCPVAEATYERLLSLPMFPAMCDRDIDDVIEGSYKICAAYGT